MTSYTARALSTDKLQHVIRQVAHGFSVGTIVIFNGATYVLSESNSLANCQGSMMVSFVVDADNFYVTQDGYVIGLTTSPTNPGGAYLAGVQYYVSPSTPGTLTSTQNVTAGQINLPCFITDSATSGYFFGGSGNAIESGGLSNWFTVTSGLTMALNTGYHANGGGMLSFAIPPIFTVGSTFRLTAFSAGGFQITMGVTVKVSGIAGSTTAGGTITSTVQGNTIEIVGVVASTDPNPELIVVSSKGALTYA